MIDVGYGMEAADAKIKGEPGSISSRPITYIWSEYLQTYTRFPQTLRVFFGGKFL
jgi:hypothetical protein